MKTQEREISRRGFYIRWTKSGIYRTLANAHKKQPWRYYQLKTGYGEVGTFLARKGLNYRNTRMLLVRRNQSNLSNPYTPIAVDGGKKVGSYPIELDKVGIRWRAQAERRWLANLVRSKQNGSGSATEIFGSNGS